MKLRTLNEAAELLGVSRRRLREGIADGRYPTFRWGNRQLVDLDTLRKIIEREDAARNRMIGTKACAEAVGVSPSTLRRMAVAGVVPSIKEGRYWWFDLDAVTRAIRLALEEGERDGGS